MAPGCTMSVHRSTYAHSTRYTCDNLNGSDALTCDLSQAVNDGDKIADAFFCYCITDYCGTIYENSNLSGWLVHVDQHGDRSQEPNLSSQGKRDQMSGIKVAPGCQITTYNDKNFGHTQFTFDNTDGTEDKEFRDIGGANDNGDSYQCSCE